MIKLIKILLKVTKPLYMPVVKKLGINVLKKLGVLVLIIGGCVAIYIAFNKIYKTLSEKVPFLGK